MRESTKYVLGAATIWPLLFSVFFVFFVISLFINPPFDTVAADGSVRMPANFYLMMVLNMVTGFLTLGMMVFYIVHAVRNLELTQDRKVLWVLGLFFATILVMPVYFYIYFWREPQVARRAPYGLHRG